MYIIPRAYLLYSGGGVDGVDLLHYTFVGRWPLNCVQFQNMLHILCAGSERMCVSE